MDFDKIKKPLITNNKGNIGHCFLGASTIESVFTLKSMQEGLVTYIKNLENPCVPELNYVMKENVKKDINVYMKTSVGLGGNIACLLYKKFNE